ncbi:hypothetical protein CDAR_538011 [Caerostris darwini]|uniref:Uncharacterized protein n=1 Tax=Caerostris darwini TaxID=1538125 RepID=A0AAV4THB4_9ARAC|nr:hypothetical protein CDAR_538011 [Caerostris darwini]
MDFAGTITSTPPSSVSNKWPNHNRKKHVNSDARTSSFVEQTIAFFHSFPCNPSLVNPNSYPLEAHRLVMAEAFREVLQCTILTKLQVLYYFIYIMDFARTTASTPRPKRVHNP